MIEGYLPVMRIPASCAECNFKISNVLGFKVVYKCKAIKNKTRLITDREKELCSVRPDWCPIQKMPEPKDQNSDFDFFGGLARGHNNIIEEMNSPK